MRFYPTTTCFVFFSFLVSVSPFVTIVCCWRRWDREILLPKSVMKRENVMMLLAYLYKLCTCLWCKSIHYEIPLAGQVNERIARWPFEIACELLLLHTSARWMFHFDAVRFFNTSPSIEPSDKQSRNDNDVMAVNSSPFIPFWKNRNISKSELASCCWSSCPTPSWLYNIDQFSLDRMGKRKEKV